MIRAQDDQLVTVMEETPTDAHGYLNRGLLRAGQSALKNPNLTPEEKEGIIILMGLLIDMTLTEDQSSKALKD